MFYNMLGELIEKMEDVPALELVHFRPRATNFLKADSLKKLKKDYKKKYGELFKEEETNEKKQQNDVIKDKRKKIRDDFLNNFFIPLRREFEEDIEKYKSLFPIKDSDMNTEEVAVSNIYQFNEVITTRKLENLLWKFNMKYNINYQMKFI